MLHQYSSSLYIPVIKNLPSHTNAWDGRFPRCHPNCRYLPASRQYCKGYKPPAHHRQLLKADRSDILPVHTSHRLSGRKSRTITLVIALIYYMVLNTDVKLYYIHNPYFFQLLCFMLQFRHFILLIVCGRLFPALLYHIRYYSNFFACYVSYFH